MNSAEIRVLQALRAPGGIDAMQAGERWPSAGTRGLYALVKRGFAERIDDTFFITDAGRAACPNRNPLAGKPATPPEVFTMPKGEISLTRQQVLDVIVAAGPSGITRNELIKMFSCEETIIDNHVMHINRAQPPVIYKPRPGLLIDIRFKPVGAMEKAPEPASTATAVQAEAPVTHDIHGTSLDVDHHEAADLSTEHLEQQMAQIGNLLPNLDEFEKPKMAAGGYVPLGEKFSDYRPTLIPVVEEIRISDPETVEFCIYSSGGLDIVSDDAPPITLDKLVLAKLRGFLGLFQEAV